MEDNEIKEKRKQKYLEKMRNKYKENDNKNNNNNTNNSSLINNITPIQENGSSAQINKKIISDSEKKPQNNNKSIWNNNDENSLFNLIKNDYKKIDYEATFKKVKKLEFIKVIINMIKKVFIILLSICHYCNHYNLENIKTLIFTLLVTEITALLLDLYFTHKIKKVIKSVLIKYDNTKEEYDIPLNNIFKMFNNYTVELTFVDYIFKIFNILIDIFIDICLLFLTNFILFIIYEEDE